MEQLKKKYGLPTAIAMVVGIVIGSGVFFKAEVILTKTGGDMPLGILAWLIGGLIMIACSCAFAVMATKYEYVNGVVDYADVTVGKKYGYMVGWFLATIYYPTLTSVLAWLSARYLCVLIGYSIAGPECFLIAALFLVSNYALNALSPKLAGKFQVSTTIIKLIPLALMAVVGTIVGLANGMTVQNFSSAAVVATSGSPLFAAVVATAFAYEGWIIATSINAELKDAKKNLPKALVLGAFVVVAIYIFYYIGIAGGVTKDVMMAGGENGARIAFSTIFSNVGGTILFVFIVISCLGTLNGLMLGCTRGFYSLAARNVGPKPEVFKQIDKVTNMPTNSSIVGVLLAAVWLVYFYGANLTGINGAEPWFGPFCFDSSELPIITLYAMYIPMFIMFMKKEKDMGVFKRIILPLLALCGSLFMVFAAIYAHGMAVVYYLIIFAVVMVIGLFFSKPKEISAN
ncbi:MAG: APC family permease [Clostridia bacterium]